MLHVRREPIRVHPDRKEVRFRIGERVERTADAETSYLTTVFRICHMELRNNPKNFTSFPLLLGPKLPLTFY